MIPAVAGLKKQGANNGASVAFLVATPETGVDSIALTYSLLDPILTIIRPVTAFFTATVAGVAENLFGKSYIENAQANPSLSCTVDGCSDGTGCDPKEHASHHTFSEKLHAGIRFAFDELMADLAIWFMLGVLLAGLIAALVPDSFIADNLGSGIVAYGGMLAASLPMYVCASMSTPIAAALVMKGMSPGAALVLLMAGPATNMATLTTVGGILGKRTLGIYLASIVICTLAFAFITDAIYGGLGISAQVSAGAEAREILPAWLEIASAIMLAALILRVVWRGGVKPLLSRFMTTMPPNEPETPPSACEPTPEAGDT